jgi:hypothetical protein
VDVFVGDQSFIFRTDSEKEVKDFTGLKRIDSEGMKKYLYALNDLAPLMGKPPAESATPPQDFLGKIAARLKVMGAKTPAQALKTLNRATGAKLKRMPKPGDLTPVQEQKLYATLLQGKANGKK